MSSPVRLKRCLFWKTSIESVLFLIVFAPNDPHLFVSLLSRYTEQCKMGHDTSPRSRFSNVITFMAVVCIGKFSQICNFLENRSCNMLKRHHQRFNYVRCAYI